MEVAREQNLALTMDGKKCLDTKVTMFGGWDLPCAAVDVIGLVCFVQAYD